jgi:electron transfer flavoprotein alpha subunit
MAVKLNPDRCIGCGCCCDASPSGALELDEKALLNEEVCIECKSCIDMCPEGALAI